MRKFWTDEEDIQLAKLISKGYKPEYISKAMSRTRASISCRIQVKGLQTHYTNIQDIKFNSYIDFITYLYEKRVSIRAKTLDSGCVVWDGATSNFGYPQIRANKRIYVIHRIVMEIRIGRKLSHKEHALHRCDNPACFNPNHLFTGSHRDNVIDMMEKGRGGGQFKKGHINVNTPKGVNCYLSKLTEAHVLEIRAKHIPKKYGAQRIADEYGISKGTVAAILTRRTWKHI